MIKTSFIAILASLVSVTSFAQAQEVSDKAQFNHFLTRFDNASLPHYVDVGMLFCCNEKPERMDSSMAYSFLPLDSLEREIGVLDASMLLYDGFLAWQTTEALEDENHHKAIVWYAEIEEGLDTHYYGFLTTFTPAGAHIQTHQIAYNYDGFNGSESESAWLLDWLDEWSIVKGYYSVSRGINWSAGGFGGQELFAVKLNGHIISVTN